MKSRDNNPSEPCHICGDIGVEKFIMTCFNCREVREHIYCAKISLRSVPDMWLCQVCRSPSRALHISNLVDNDIKDLATDYLMSNDVSPRKKRKPQFLAFPSPKRKPRTPRFPEDIEDINRR
ncbi:uncharacterized protein LOC18017000 [Eutrema salsugineum]|uniref:uncharacterized protein LOC18017000 n=1 Tax=Eutrema salsugineum TaxID=72664 RepID=UPI000CED5169|nr:uncharacterized protein LOC18017000 [Eutrema salsugineum]